MSDADSASPTPLRGRNGPSECSSRGTIARARARSSQLGVEQRLVERRGLQDLPLHRRRRGQQPHVDVGERLRQALALGALDQSRDLQQLEVAHDAVGDVQVGVQAQLAEPAGDTGDALEDLLAKHPQGALQALRRAIAVLLADGRLLAGLRDDRLEVAGEVGGARAGNAADVAPSPSSASASQALLLLGGVPRREQARLAHGDALDQAREEDVGRDLAQFVGRRPVQLDEPRDAFARLGRHRVATRWPPQARPRGRACAAARPGSPAPGRPGAGRSAAGREPGRQPRRPADRRAAAATRARHGPPLAAGTRPPLPLPAGPHGPRLRSLSRTQPKDTRCPIPAGLRSWCGDDRLGDCAADRRDGRRVPSPRRRQRGGRRAAGPRLRRRG